MAPASFHEVGRAADEVLRSDFVLAAAKLPLCCRSAGGVEVASEGMLAAGGKGVSGRLSFKLAPLPGVDVKKLAVDTAGRMQGEVRVEHAALQGAAVTLKAEDGAGAPTTAEVGLDYMAGPLNLSASVDVTSPGGPALWGAGTVAYEQFFVGGEVKYATGNKEQPLADYNACAGYVAGDITAALQTKSKASQVQLSVHQKYSKDVELATEYIHSRKLLTVGALYKLDASTTLQGKVDSCGLVSCNALQVISAGVKLVSSVEIDATNLAGDAHRFGMTLHLG